MDDATTKRQFLQRAADLLGQDELAWRLSVPSRVLQAWIRGDITMPDGKLLVLAVVLENFPRPD